MLSKRAPLWLKFVAIFSLVLLQVPLLAVILNALTGGGGFYDGLSFQENGEWNVPVWSNPEIWSAFLLSLRVAAISTVIALALGTLLAASMARHAFFGRQSVSLLIILPIAIPGAVWGVALQATISFGILSNGLWAIIVGQATFCILLVYNNAAAALRKQSGSLIQASLDLGANGFQTFRYVVLPNLAPALLAGALLAFVLSFNEIVVTSFIAQKQNTLPVWMFETLQRNPYDHELAFVAMLVLIASAVPIVLATYLMRKRLITPT